MGTSKHYSPPKGGIWTGLKGSITTMIRENNFTQQNLKSVIFNFIQAKGESSSAEWNITSKEAAKKLASFIINVDNVGFKEQLESIGLESLIGQPLRILIFSLIDYFCNSSNTLDQVIARKALFKTLDEILQNANSPDEIEEIIKNCANNNSLEKILFLFFGNYIFEQFIANFYESHLKKLGIEIVDSEIQQIHEFILSLFRNKTYGKELLKISWTGEEGEKIISEIQNITFNVFRE